MASNQIQQTGSFYLSGSFSASLGFDGTASYAKKATRVDNTITSGDGIESFAYNGGGAATVAVDTSSAHFNAPINAITGSVVKSGSISGTTLNLHLGDGTTLANIIASSSFATTASYALNASGDTGVGYDEILVSILNYAGQNRYTINGLQAPTLTLSRGGTYRFDQSDATNAGQTLGFRTIAGVNYTTGVTTVGTAGSAGAYTEIVVGFDTPVDLRYVSPVGGPIYGNLLSISDMHSLSATGSLQGTLDGTATSASLATENVKTASAVLNTITFTRGDGTTFNVSVAQSGSVATASFAETVEFSGILNKPTLVSGSAQISYTGITDITPGLVSASAQITLEDTTFTDGDAFSVLRTDGAGNVAFNFADRAYFNIRAQEVLVKGDPIYVSGYSAGQDRVLVSKADASDPAKMPAIGLAAEALAVNANGQGITVGVLDNAATNTFTAGDELYVANGGGLTATVPTGGDEVQPVGIVIRSDAALGRINVAARMSSATAASATVDTGSLLTTASIDGVDITFTKGDASTFDITVDTGSSTADSASFSTRVTDLEDFSSSLDVTYVTEAELVAATASLSSSLTTTDQTISSSVATLSGSASDSRNLIVSSISGAFSIPAGTVSSSAQTIANLPAGTVSGSVQVSDITGSSIITGSVQGNTLTFTKGDLTTFDLLVITSSGGGGSTNTGSLLTTASVSETTMSFTKGDASTFEVYITASVSASYAQTASLLLGSVETASFAFTSSFVTASNVHGPHGISSVATASKVDPVTALTGLENYADDTAATIGGIKFGGLYRNGNFVLIRVTNPYVDSHYLTGWSDANFITSGAGLTGFLSQGNPWSFGFRLAGTIPASFGNGITSFSTDTGAVAVRNFGNVQFNSWMHSNVSAGTQDNFTSNPTQTDPSYWLFSYNGTTLTIYYNGTQVDTSTANGDLPTTTSGNVAFGKSIIAGQDPWSSTVGVSALYFSDQALAQSINTTAAANNGDIASDSEFSKVNSFINVDNGSLVDVKGNYSPTVSGTLTYTAK